MIIEAGLEEGEDVFREYIPGIIELLPLRTGLRTSAYMG